MIWDIILAVMLALLIVSIWHGISKWGSAVIGVLYQQKRILEEIKSYLRRQDVPRRRE